MMHSLNEPPTIGWRFWISWVCMTTVGILTGVFIAAISGIKGLPVPLAFIILTGTITGITQWVVLRQNIPRVDYWILVNFVGSCLGGSTGVLTFLHWNFNSPDVGVFVSLISYGVVSEFFTSSISSRHNRQHKHSIADDIHLSLNDFEQWHNQHTQQTQQLGGNSSRTPA